MATVRPTKKQRQLLDYIAAFIGEHGYSPSYREIMAGCGYTSIATVAVHINNLIARGHLRKRDHSARSLELCANGGEATEGALPDDVTGDEAGAAWLAARIDGRFSEAEKLGTVSGDDCQALQVLAAAAGLLGLDAVADRSVVRLQALRQRAGAADSS